MNATLTQQLDKLLDLWEHFPASKSAPQPAHDDGKVWVLFVEKEIQQLMLPSVFERAMAIRLYYFDSVQWMKEGDLVRALALIEEGDRQALALSDTLAYLFVKQFQLSARALYFHKQGQFEAAFSLTLECIAINEYLIRQGCPSMMFRCLEQNINVSRIYAKQGLYQEEQRLLKSLSGFLLENNATGVWGTMYTETLRQGSSYLEYVQEGTLRSYMELIATKLMEAGAHCQAREQELFKAILGPFSDFNTPTLDRVIIYNWLYLKRAYYAQEYECFLEGIPVFLSERLPRHFDVLKLSLCQNLLYLTGSLPYSNAPTMHQHLLRYVEDKLMVKSRLKAFIDIQKP